MEAIINFSFSAEKVLRVTGYIPIVSIVTSVFGRMPLAQIQGMVGSFGVAYCGVMRRVCELQGEVVLAAEYARILGASGNLVVNAGLNLERAMFELVPIVGNLVCFIYDRVMEGGQLFPYMPKLAAGLVPA